MRVSSIEIGTNSTKFIIAEIAQNGSFKVLKKVSTANRLSGGMYPQNNLKTSAVEKEIEIIEDYINDSNAHGAELLSIFSTSVLRDAGNKQILLDPIKEKYGIDIKTIDGDTEAYFAYMSCKQIVKNKEQKFAVIDIGGGSTEITAGNCENIEAKASLNVGAVRLTEMFVKHDPIIKSEVEQISMYTEQKIEEMGLFDLSGLQLVGTGGTIKSLGTMSKKENYSDEIKINGDVLSIKDIEQLFELLSRLTIDSKKNLVGLNPKRADVITTGVIILLTIMRKFKIDEITISTKGVIEGFISDYKKINQS
jgi:exopolyphosphatase/guanosine-5'-triphosphate,3'-diphosphate pyrophosphatase